MTDMTVEEQISAKFNGVEAPDPAPEPAEPAGEDTAEQTEQQTDDRPRNADGTFAPKEAEPSEKLFADKYKTVEELERGYEELSNHLRNTRGTADPSELAALRADMAAIRDQIQKPTAPSYDAGSLDDQFASNPTVIPAYAQRALETRDDLLYGKAMAAWHDHDSFGAAAFHANAVAAAEVAKLREEFAPALKVSQEVQSTNAFGQAFAAAQASLPADFGQVMDNITPETAASMKTVVEILANGTPASQQAALETLYWAEKGRQAGSINQATTQAAQQVAQEAAQDRMEAAVASASGSADRIPQPVSPNDAFRQAFQASDAFKKYSGQ